MDEQEKRKQILGLDPNLTPQERHRRIMEIMSNSKSDSNTPTTNPDTPIEDKEDEKVDEKVDERIDEKLDSDCQHYQRGCMKQCPDCKLFVKCRLCHDAKITSHSFNRFAVNTVLCNNCNLKQSPSGCCTGCGHVFGNYFCSKCNLYENNTAKDIYHCDSCGMCRVGKRENYFHCNKCDHCIHVDSLNTHKCFAGTWSDCPICMDTLKDSTKQLFLLPCGHGTHLECVSSYLQSDYRCPVCKKSIGDMTSVWKRMRDSLNVLTGNAEIKLISEQGEVLKKTCICNDCGESYETERNVFNMYYCPKCSSFNCS